MLTQTFSVELAVTRLKSRGGAGLWGGGGVYDTKHIKIINEFDLCDKIKSIETCFHPHCDGVSTMTEQSSKILCWH